MVVLLIPKLTRARKLTLVRAAIDRGRVTCKDDIVRRDVQALKPPGGHPTDDPEPDWTLARQCVLYMAARIVTQTPNGTDKPPAAGVVL